VTVVFYKEIRMAVMTWSPKRTEPSFMDRIPGIYDKAGKNFESFTDEGYFCFGVDRVYGTPLEGAFARCSYAYDQPLILFLKGDDHVNVGSDVFYGPLERNQDENAQDFLDRIKETAKILFNVALTEQKDNVRCYGAHPVTGEPSSLIDLTAVMFVIDHRHDT
jgi:hypothetical protein